MAFKCPCQPKPFCDKRDRGKEGPSGTQGQEEAELCTPWHSTLAAMLRDRVPADMNHPGLPSPAQPWVLLPLPAEAASHSRALAPTLPLPGPRTRATQLGRAARARGAAHNSSPWGTAICWGGHVQFRGDGVTAPQGSPPEQEKSRSHGWPLALPAPQPRTLQPLVLGTARALAGGTGEGYWHQAAFWQGGRAPPWAKSLPALEGFPSTGGFLLFNSPGFRGKRNLPPPTACASRLTHPSSSAQSRSPSSKRKWLRRADL